MVAIVVTGARKSVLASPDRSSPSTGHESGGNVSGDVGKDHNSRQTVMKNRTILFLQPSRDAA